MMAPSERTVVLGEVELPSGTMVVIDPGLGRFWRHDGDPASPRQGDPPQSDLDIVGPDAVEAGRRYDRQFDPRFLYDVRDPDRAIAHFEEFCRKEKLDARAVVRGERVPHTARARHALAAGDGMGVVQYNNRWGVVVDKLPAGRRLPVIGRLMPDGELGGRFRSVDVVIDDCAEVVRSRTVQGVMVEHGQLLCVGLEPLGAFKMWEPADGLADYVFWGRDAERLAAALGAARLDDDLYGWRDLPMDAVGRYAMLLRERVERERLVVGVDYRPHDNLEKLNAQIRTSNERSGVITLDGNVACGFDNRWGDGIFDVVLDYDAAGQVVRVRLDVGNEATQERMRAVRRLSKKAIVSRRIVDERQPVRFAERMDPIGPDDSGWGLSSGTETEAYMGESSNFALVPLGEMVRRFPALQEILDAPVGSVFRLAGDRYVPDV
jgi:hypothetical protein